MHLATAEPVADADGLWVSTVRRPSGIETRPLCYGLRDANAGKIMATTFEDANAGKIIATTYEMPTLQKLLLRPSR